MKSRSFYMIALALSLSIFKPETILAARPNVVIILTDDQGWGDLSVHGNSNLSTPNIDKLAVDGAQFDRFYVCSVCSPTRAEFLTGRFHPRSSVFSTSQGGERIDLDEQTIAEHFNSAGYVTAAFGKWHNGMQYPYHPNARGFDEYYGFCSGHWGHYFSPMLEHNGQITKGDGFVIDDFTNRALKFMEDNQDKPFFVYLPYNTPHSPYQVPDQFWEKFKDNSIKMRHNSGKEKLEHTRPALAMCENIDWNVGRVLKKIDELKIAEDTIVVYFCDNGPNGFRWNGGMKGKKGSTDEGGVRSPLFIKWPGKIAKGLKVPQIASAIDILPTLTDLAGVKTVSKKSLDGLSLKKLLFGETNDWPERNIVSHWAGRVSVRSQQYRLDNEGKLFDIAKDPAQKKDLTKKLPEISKALKKEADDYRKNVLSEIKKGRPFVIGHPESKFTQIPARDGIAHGGIKRSDNSPNCTFFTNWKTLQDKITWSVDVGQTGDYQVEIYYTCPKEDVGSTFELSFNAENVKSKITEAHDPPLVGAKEDRLLRTQSYVKDFKVLKMGNLHLKKGKGELVLKALEIPGENVMDFRLLFLTRVTEK